jgi:hypothetical protein
MDLEAREGWSQSSLIRSVKYQQENGISHQYRLDLKLGTDVIQNFFLLTGRGLSGIEKVISCKPDVTAKQRESRLNGICGKLWPLHFIDVAMTEFQLGDCRDTTY